MYLNSVHWQQRKGSGPLQYSKALTKNVQNSQLAANQWWQKEIAMAVLWPFADLLGKLPVELKHKRKPQNNTLKY